MKSDGGGGTRRKRRAGRRTVPMAEINVTPFVDVMLVLLIIFMVAAPLSIVGVPIDLPETTANALVAEPEEPLTVTIIADGSLQLQSSPVADSEIVNRLRGVIAERESDRIFLRIDKVNDWDRIAQVIGALNAAGFNGIDLVMDNGGAGLAEPEG